MVNEYDNDKTYPRDDMAILSDKMDKILNVRQRGRSYNRKFQGRCFRCNRVGHKKNQGHDHSREIDKNHRGHLSHEVMVIEIQDQTQENENHTIQKAGVEDSDQEAEVEIV